METEHDAIFERTRGMREMHDLHIEELRRLNGSRMKKYLPSLNR
jgi:hypothetical protein